MDATERRLGAVLGQLAPVVESMPIVTSAPVTAAPAAVSSPAATPVQHGGLLAADALREHGVTCVFTLTGGHIAPLLVGCAARGVRVVDVRHEATAVFAADCVSRMSGITGVAIVTAGPGLTNTVTAVKNAQLAQSPLVLLTGATAMILKGRGSLQDIDQLQLMDSAVKAKWSLHSVRDIIPTLRRAFKVAQEGVPGPVMIEFPIEVLWPRDTIAEQIGIRSSTPPPLLPLSRASVVQRLKHVYLNRHLANVFDDAFTPVKPPTPDAHAQAETVRVSPRAVRAVFKAIAAARAPIFLIGSQAIKAGPAGAAPDQTHTELLKRALERLGVPVFVSGMARGLLGPSHPLLLRHNRRQILKRSDFILLAGVPTDFRLEYGRNIPATAKFAAVNLCATQLTKNSDIRKAEIAVQADPLEFVKRLAEMRPAAAAASGAQAVAASPLTNEWRQFVRAQQDEREAEIDRRVTSESSDLRDSAGNSVVHPLRLCRILDEILPERSIIVADGGDFVGTASYILRPRHALSWIDPGVFGTLGVGAGFAIAAKITHPEETVVQLWGDGACGFSIVEFDTCQNQTNSRRACTRGTCTDVRMRLPVIAIIGNDACWTQMWRDQVRLLKSDVATELAFARYDLVAAGLGGRGILVRSEEEIRPAFAQALEFTKQGLPVCINVMIAKSGFREGSISL